MSYGVDLRGPTRVDVTLARQASVDVALEQARYVQGLNGLSAYELAVQNGFSGTVEEWLESLSFHVKDIYPTLDALAAAFPAGDTNVYQVTAEGDALFLWSERAGQWRSIGAVRSGKSAYEAAVDGGYDGSEEQFQADLATVGDFARQYADGTIAAAITAAAETAVDTYFEAHGLNEAITQAEAEAIWSTIGPYDDDPDVVGVQLDYSSGTYTRLAAARGLHYGAEFDQFPAFGGRRRCNVADDGAVLAWYGDDDYKEDGSNGQVMVYQPAFWYRVVPLKCDAQETGFGYHLRKADYYVSSVAKPGFRLHPAFYDANGNAVDHIFYSAYRGSIYDTSAGAYLMQDEQAMDADADLWCSIAGAKPASGVTQQLTRANVEKLAANRGTGWHGDLIKPVSANQLLMLIECAGNLQTVIGMGVVNITGQPNTTNNSSLTGSTSSLGNASGRAAMTLNERGGTYYEETENGKTSVTYRGMEDPWGNIANFVSGVNIWGNGSMAGGQPYICSDFEFAENKNTGNYEAAGFAASNASGYISAMGYSAEHDYLFVPSEADGGAAGPIGDYVYTAANLSVYRVAILGGLWSGGTSCGGFWLQVNNGAAIRDRSVGGRLVYIPTAE